MWIFPIGQAARVFSKRWEKARYLEIWRDPGGRNRENREFHKIVSFGEIRTPFTQRDIIITDAEETTHRVEQARCGVSQETPEQVDEGVPEGCFEDLQEEVDAWFSLDF